MKLNNEYIEAIKYFAPMKRKQLMEIYNGENTKLDFQSWLINWHYEHELTTLMDC